MKLVYLFKDKETDQNVYIFQLEKKYIFSYSWYLEDIFKITTSQNQVTKYIENHRGKCIAQYDDNLKLYSIKVLDSTNNTIWVNSQEHIVRLFNTIGDYNEFQFTY